MEINREDGRGAGPWAPRKSEESRGNDFQSKYRRKGQRCRQVSEHLALGPGQAGGAWRAVLSIFLGGPGLSVSPAVRGDAKNRRVAMRLGEGVVEPSRENRPAGWERGAAAGRPGGHGCPAGFYSEENVGLVEDVKSIAKAGVEKTQARAPGPLGDPAVAARGLCLGASPPPAAARSEWCGAWAATCVGHAVPSVGQGPPPPSRGRPEQHPRLPLAPALRL